LVTPRLTRDIVYSKSEFIELAVGQEFFANNFRVAFFKNAGAAKIADLVIATLDHAVAPDLVFIFGISVS